jgi:tetratricopeptide (TPR) repeat protein
MNNIRQFCLITFTAAWAIVLLPCSTSAQTATVREGLRTFRTYPFGDPDPVPRIGNIYPYFRFEGYTSVPTEKQWNVVTLENPYIRVLIAPEIGGKVLGAFEKSTGRPFIYFNNVVKFREIAMRGPWTSGGIEFNFGDIGHAPSTATPVDYVTRTNADGSASCIVGTIDLPSRTEWRVEIRLPRDKAYFEARSFWYNPTELPTSLYHWMNAAADADSDLFFIYPGTAYIDHGGLASSWPLAPDGKDLSLYRNNAFGGSKSYHVLGTYTDFFGLGWKNRDFGVVHWADYVDKPGKKLWIWALSREGGIWTDLLTDTDLGNSQYVEFQSGLLFNQALVGSSLTPFKHRTFAPFSEERFTEAWFPFKTIGSVVRANRHGVLNVEQHGHQLVFGFCPLEQVNQELIVNSGATECYRKKLSLRPMQAFVDSITIAGNADVQVRVGTFIEYRSTDAKSRTLERPLEANRGFDWTSVQGLATDAAEYARERDYNGALERYRACLAQDSLYTPALTGAAGILYRRMEYDPALASVNKALANDTYDPTANFIYGNIQRQRGKIENAIDGFGIAARSTEYRSAANTALAEIACQQRDWQRAVTFAERAQDYDRYNMRALMAHAVACRKLGQEVDARKTDEEILRLDPLSHFARFEQYLLNPGERTRRAFVSAIRSELPAEIYLELASHYYVLGLYADALQSLRFAPAHPIVDYWRGYLNNRLGNNAEAEKWLWKASERSINLVFPFRNETAEVLTWVESRSAHWKPRYYLALILWSKGRQEEARSLMTLCGNSPEDAPFYMARGNLFRGMNDSLSVRDYRRAVELGADTWRPYSALASFYNDHTQYREALETLRTGTLQLPANYVLQFDYARSLLYNRRYKECLALLDTLKILPFEGAGYGRELHRQAALFAACESFRSQHYQEALALVDKAREWPEHLGAGKPYDVDERMEDYVEALCKRRIGDSASAGQLFSRVVGSSPMQPTHDAQYCIVLLALQGLGRTAEADSALERWEAAEPQNPVVIWASGALRLDARKPATPPSESGTAIGRPWNSIPSDPNYPVVREIASLPTQSQ